MKVLRLSTSKFAAAKFVTYAALTFCIISFTFSTYWIYINNDIQREELYRSVHVSSWFSYQAQLEYAKLEQLWITCLGWSECDGAALLQQAELFASRLDVLANSDEATVIPYVGAFRSELGELFGALKTLFGKYPAEDSLSLEGSRVLASRLRLLLADTGHLLQDLLSEATLYNSAMERREAALRDTSPLYPFTLLGASGGILVVLLLLEVRRRGTALAQLEQLRQEERLQQENMRNLLGTLPMPVCVIDDNGRLTYSNNAAHVAFAANLHLTVQKLASVGLPQALEETPLQKLALMAADGQQRAFNGHATPVDWQDYSGTVWILNDATSEGNAQLQTLAVGRMAILGELSASIAHELNQPLATIKAATLNAELLLTNINGSEPSVRKMRRISQQVDRISQIVTNIRKLSRPVVIEEPFAVQTAIASCMNITRQQMTLSGIEVQLIDRCPGLAYVRGDHTLLEICLVNILLNARDAFKVATLDVDNRMVLISLKQIDMKVELRIADNAGGIAPDILPRIFESFVSSKSSAEGMGIGLAISRRAVTQMGGQISAANRDHGAEFVIELPLVGASS